MLKITAIGNLTNDVELKVSETTGKPYAILRIASDRRYEAFLPGTPPSKNVRARYLFCFSYRHQPVSLLFTSIPAKTEVFYLLLSARSI